VFEIDLLADEPVTMTFMPTACDSGAGMRGGEPASPAACCSTVSRSIRENRGGRARIALDAGNPRRRGFGPASERVEARRSRPTDATFGVVGSCPAP